MPAFFSGLGLTALVMAALAALGALVFEPHPNYPVMFANFVSNFYEEFIFRGAILGLLLYVMGRERAWPAGIHLGGALLPGTPAVSAVAAGDRVRGRHGVGLVDDSLPKSLARLGKPHRGRHDR